MKLPDWARKQGISYITYITAWRWFKGWPSEAALPGVPREVTPVEIPLAAERLKAGLRAMGRRSRKWPVNR